MAGSDFRHWSLHFVQSRVKGSSDRQEKGCGRPIPNAFIPAASLSRSTELRAERQVRVKVRSKYRNSRFCQRLHASDSGHPVQLLGYLCNTLCREVRRCTNLLYPLDEKLFTAGERTNGVYS